MTVGAGLFSVMIRGQKEEDAIFYVSITALLNSAFISSLWVMGNPQLKIFTVQKIKTLCCLSEVDYVVHV